jgi:chromosome segregation protein
VVGPNGSGKSNVAEAFRFALGEQSMKSMRGRRGEDLIWNGSVGVPRGGRAGVKLIFDNSDRKLDLDFDEVAIERVVHRGGENEYLLNGSPVRLRDIAALLAQANIGASGHHIISQGEADRILSTSSRERREMLEDALGLTAYLYKREEAQNKLQKTQENLREVEALRRELSPHLKFLAAQVKKIEESKKLQEDLAAAYCEYLKRESVYLQRAEGELKEEEHEPKREHARLGATIEHLREELESKGKSDKGTRELMRLEEEERQAATTRERATRELGRIEGELAARERLEAGGTVPRAQVLSFAQRLSQALQEALALEGTPLKERLRAALAAAQEFVAGLSQQGGGGASAGELAAKKKKLESELEHAKTELERVAKAIAALRKKIEGEKDASREAERELFAAMARRSELEGMLSGLAARRELLARAREQFKEEVREAGVLAPRAVLEYEAYALEAGEAPEPRAKQEERRKKLERMKIKLEEAGLGGSEAILKEHQETTERDQFLARELEDIAASRQKLEGLIEELTETLQTRFSDGVKKINTEFDRFFKLMFGGGSASLSIVKEKKLRKGAALGEELEEAEDDMDEEDDVEVEEGVDIAVTIPHKRVKGLHMLSGGERALTSIALIFAMSQVNPPPFLILDETDAALDEANSRRYGDMIESLAKKSQLILITHNRETMSRAGVLYGVTMGNDGVSKLLSVQFEEALSVAK